MMWNITIYTVSYHGILQNDDIFNITAGEMSGCGDITGGSAQIIVDYMDVGV